MKSFHQAWKVEDSAFSDTTGVPNIDLLRKNFYKDFVDLNGKYLKPATWSVFFHAGITDS